MASEKGDSTAELEDLPLIVLIKLVGIEYLKYASEVPWQLGIYSYMSKCLGQMECRSPCSTGYLLAVGD